MITSKLLYAVFLLSFFVSFASFSSSFDLTPRCPEQQRDALLLFKQNLSSINFVITNPRFVSICEDWLGSYYYPIMTNWNTSTNCCNWDGVTCDHSTGDVIGLDLSCGMLQGSIHPNTSLFNLPRLETLNLAFNDFTGSRIPREIDRFASSLTHLNISSCGFTGQVPTNITFLRNLVSLDLSKNGLSDFVLEPNVLFDLLHNFTRLEDLSLAGVYISSVLPTDLNISSSLRLLDIRYANLQGEIPRSIFKLQFLEKLYLSYNLLEGNIPSEISILPNLVSLDLSWNELDNLKMKPRIFNSLLKNSTRLRDLSLVQVNIGSVLPTCLDISSSLKSLDLRYTSLRGKLPENIFSLSYLEELDLSQNNNVTGPLPKVNTSTRIPLKRVGLSGNLSSEIPNSIGHLEFLTDLSLPFCGLVGSLPESLVNLRHLVTLRLSNNILNGTLPSWLFTLPSLEIIFLDHNMLHGNLPSQMFNHRSLQALVLGNNQFVEEPILQSFSKLVNLSYLDLSYNHFRGVWDLDVLLSSLKSLDILDLSHSGLTVTANSNASGYVNPGFFSFSLASCKLTVFPESLRAMKYLFHLDLSSNEIHGDIPTWVGEIGANELSYLNISHNFITGLPPFQWSGLLALYLQSNQIEGPFPPSISNMINLLNLDMSDNRFSGVIPDNISSSVMYLNVKSNQIGGSFPPSICNMSYLYSLDMSNNSFDGVIPECVGSVSSLLMLDLGNNRFQGNIPVVYGDGWGQLEGLILNGNRLQGKVPRSLSKCRSLKVLDLGNNHFNGTFPSWLGDLPNLQVVVLRSNNLNGPVETLSRKKVLFSRLRVIDLSHNGFVGNLPKNYFQNFNAMKNLTSIAGSKPEYLYVGNKYYSTIVVVKDLQLLFTRFLVDYTIVDLSNNRFVGEIPNVIGSLNSLKVLNLSHNDLNGRIPNALGNLLQVESLDLSYNQLTGQIPQGLADITGLAVLNISQNHLVGRIPRGKQFNTFDENSFGGNWALCGFPLPKQCEHSISPNPEADGDEEESGFTWEAVMLGYGCGTLLGIVMGYLMLSTGTPKWFTAIANAGENIILKRRNKRRIIYIGK